MLGLIQPLAGTQTTRLLNAAQRALPRLAKRASAKTRQCRKASIGRRVVCVPITTAHGEK